MKDNFLSVICNKTNQKVYDYVCEHGMESIALYRAKKRFNEIEYRLTFDSDYNHAYNKNINLGYEIIGELCDERQVLEYCGQTIY